MLHYISRKVNKIMCEVIYVYFNYNYLILISILMTFVKIFKS
jgi:hypothetical protein